MSADAENAISTLSAAAPVLVGAHVRFKICATLDGLERLNSGMAGMTQIGKFITAYPTSTGAAIELARRLDEALPGASGPVVPSDRPLHLDSVVSYRFGGFTSRWIQSSFGYVVPAIERDDGVLVPDERRAATAVPPWLEDPFRAAGVAREMPPPPDWIADRFRVLAVLERGPRGAVYMAIDGARLERCVLKVARRGDGTHSTAARLRREADVLESLADVPHAVRCFGVEATATEQLLALEDLGGDALDLMIGPAFDANRPPFDLASTAVQDLADAVADLHRHRIVHRDVKPSNAIRDADGRLRLLDFEMACRVGEPGFGVGTMGYASPQQSEGREAHPADDVFSIGRTAARLLGAVDVTTLATGPALARHLRASCLDLPPDVAAIVGTATDVDRAERFPSAAEFADAWRMARQDPEAVPPYGDIPVAPDERRAVERVHRYADALVADAIETDDGLTWMSRHPAAPGIPTRDLATGAAGALVVLAALAELTGAAAHRNALARGASSLATWPRFEGPPVGGLYVGDGGALLALGHVARSLEDDAIAAHARRLAAELVEMPITGPDLYNGTAGRCRALLRAAELLDEPDYVSAATDLGDHLLATADHDGDGCYWVPPDDELHQWGTIGYAHGAAGIGDVLLELGAHGGERFRDGALAAWDWIQRHRVDRGEATAFPAIPGGDPWNPLWCHGATGIGRFALRLHGRGLLDGEHVLRGIAYSTARLGRFATPVLCHGLAGAIDHLVDQFAATGDRAHLTEAWGLAVLLDAFERQGPDGQLRSLSEGGPVPTMDLSVGYGGVASAWLRLADPSRPTLVD